MRMRFKPYARPELLACDYHAHAPLENKGRWHSVFARPQQPVHLELGCGKGGFLALLAGLWWLARAPLGALGGLAACCAVLAAGCAGTLAWLRRGGARAWQRL